MKHQSQRIPREAAASDASIISEYGPFPGFDRIHGVTFDGARVWAATGETLLAFDPASGKVQRTLDAPSDAGTAFDGKYLYQIAEARIDKIDPSTGRVVHSIALTHGSGSNSGLTWAEGSLWLGQYRDLAIADRVYRMAVARSTRKVRRHHKLVTVAVVTNIPAPTSVGSRSGGYEDVELPEPYPSAQAARSVIGGILSAIRAGQPDQALALMRSVEATATPTDLNGAAVMVSSVRPSAQSMRSRAWWARSLAARRNWSARACSVRLARSASALPSSVNVWMAFSSERSRL